MRLERIIAGVDGSENARHALDWAIAIAAPIGARIIAVHALGLLDRLHDEHVPTARHRDEIIEAFRADWCAALDRSALPNDRVAIDGPPADVLIDTARARGADLIVVGARGAGRPGDGLLGSTSARVTESAGIPVLVVPENAPSP